MLLVWGALGMAAFSVYLLIDGERRARSWVAGWATLEDLRYWSTSDLSAGVGQFKAHGVVHAQDGDHRAVSVDTYPYNQVSHALGQRVRCRYHPADPSRMTLRPKAVGPDLVKHRLTSAAATGFFLFAAGVIYLAQ